MGFRQEGSPIRRALVYDGALAICVLVLGASIPFLLHLSMGNAAQVIKVESITESEIPEWVARQLDSSANRSDLYLVRLSHAKPKQTTSYLTRDRVFADELAWVISRARWRIDQRTFPRLGEETGDLAVGGLSQTTGFWARVERACAYGGPSAEPYDKLGPLAYSLSMISVVVGPFLIGLFLLRWLSRGVRLWHLVAIAWCYSLYLFIFNYFSSLDPTHESTAATYLGYLVFAIPLVLLEVWRYERSERGKDLLSRLWNSRHKFAFERI